jgi:hypothetical protein
MAETTEDVLRKWSQELKASRKREADYRKDGERILCIYDGTKSEEVPFNILFSNTETLLPAIYSATPRPTVDRRFKDDDPIGKAAGEAATRLLTFLVDTNMEGYESFDDAMTAATLNALLPGRGETRIKYDADLMELPASAPVTNDEDDDPAPAKLRPGSELICCDSKDWNRVLYGYAKKWSKVPWIAYEEYIDKAEALALFGKEKADRLNYTIEEAPHEDETRKPKPERDQGERKVASIYQIWDKEGGRVVRYYSEQIKDAWLKELPDPLNLAGFFNCPKPLQFIKKTHSLTPTAPYKLYESQARELNELTRRIKWVVKAIKAKGVYDSALGPDIKKMLDAEENEFVPADSASSLASEKGFQNAIWFMPIEQLIVTLTQLYQARESCKQVIYEITGISDILRGATQASETATAQQIKNQWGTLRLKRSQKEVARYARDLLRLMLELAATKFSEETWAAMTGLPYLSMPQALQLQMALQEAQMTGDPQQIQQLSQQLQTPQWQQILQILKDDLQRAYRVDIETNSTVEPEATEDQKQISELFTAIGQFLNGVGPLVAKGVMPFQVAQTMLLTITRRFQFGSEIEDMIKQMQPPKPEESDDGAAKEQQLQMQQQMAEGQLKMQQQQQELTLKAKTMEAEKALLEKKIDLELREIQLKAEQDKFQLEKQAATQMLTVKAQADQHKAQTDQKMVTLEKTKMKTENVVSNKIDQTVGKDMTSLKTMVDQLIKTVAEQAKEHEQTVMALVKAVTAPRTRKAIRGKDNRIESVVEEVEQSVEQDGRLQQLVSAITVPRTRKAIRGKDNRIESVTENVG